MQGKFISIEGPDGAGKSTLAKGLRDELQSRGTDCILTREPGDGPIGPQIRSILLRAEDMDPWTEVFLFLADRRQHVEGLIRPALEERKWVICDRYVDSTVVYQGYGRDLDVGLLRKLNKIATSGLMPDRTILVDLPTAVSEERMNNRHKFDGFVRLQILKINPVQVQHVLHLIESNPGDFELTVEVGVEGSTHRYETPYRVSDGPWLGELRRNVELGFVHVMRRDRIDDESQEFRQRLREGFLAEARLDPQRFVVLNGEQSPEVILANALEAIAGA